MTPTSKSPAWRTAADHLARGWMPVPVPYRTKRPVIADWQNLRLSEQKLGRYFCGRSNVGVLLGEPSNWLIDVDLDHALAIEHAPTYLPPTAATFGRRGKPKSHWLYYATSPVATRQWRLPGTRRTVVELRSTGGQTVFPGSTHSSGEPIQWDNRGEPAPVDPSELANQLEAIFQVVCSELGIGGTLHRPDEFRSTRSIPPAVLDRAARYLAKLPAAISGQGGHNATFYAACTLVVGFGLDRDTALGLLRRWNETCQPPWSEKELEHKVGDAHKQPGWRGYLLGRQPRRTLACAAIERANRHAVEHRRKARRRAEA